MSDKELSYGEKAVGKTFNPSGDSRVALLKDYYAEIIDNLDLQRAKANSGEKKRLLSIAITEAQTAQMWAVKAITWSDED